MAAGQATQSQNSILVVDGSNPIQKKRFSPVPILPTQRGPPVRPQKAEHALWVGNLPPRIDVSDLKEHFSQGATGDIQSVFLISKSSCAFVNYRSSASCIDALARFHGSQLRSSRLVCRLRQGLAASELHRRSSDPQKGLPEWPIQTLGNEASLSAAGRPRLEAHASGNRYYIVKSLTVEDLQTSTESGTWATQSHNKTLLNQAYDSANIVYLIFSANKSGEYFGYGRMSSSITDDRDLSRKMPPQTQHSLAKAEVDMTPTLVTAAAPAGIIVRDLRRGTVFWESRYPGDHDGHLNIAYEQPAWSGDFSLGPPFGVEWVSTSRVRFSRTRGLRNPWNSNREVRIARDGTELEPSVGRRLIQLFHSS